jgi:serine/threonine protein kinase
MGDMDMNQSRFDLSMFDNPIRNSPTPSPYRDADYDKLPIQDITVDLQREVVNWVHPLCRRKNWSGRIIMPWVVTQPKTALLLWMCDELDAWPKAAQFWSNLMQDSKLPYSEATLRGIAANPAKVVELQWRVGILKTLPRNGGHVEFQTQDTVPLTDHGAIGPRTGSSTIKTRIKVKYRDGADNCYYVRKRLEIHAERPTDKLAILGQIKNFHTLNHPNIAKIVSSYAQGQVVSFIMPYIEFNLDEYLDQLSGFSESERILNWVKDLASALTYIHAHNVEHKAIRPQKIFVDVPSSRIYFSVFGVSPPLRKSYAQLYAPYSNDPGYIYGAPEIVSNRSVRHQQADIFSLGCVFLEMVSVARNKPVDVFRSHRAAKTHDYSFHMNLDQVVSWIDLLKSSAVSTTPQRRVKLVKKSDRALAVAKAMLYKDPAHRPSMKSVVRHLTQTRPSTRQPRRNSADARTVGILPSQSTYFNDMYSLQSYYVAQSEYGED